VASVTVGAEASVQAESTEEVNQQRINRKNVYLCIIMAVKKIAFEANDSSYNYVKQIFYYIGFIGAVLN